MPYVVKIRSASFPGNSCYLMRSDFSSRWKWSRVLEKDLAYKFRSRIEAQRAIQQAIDEILKNTSAYQAPEINECVLGRLSSASIVAV